MCLTLRALYGMGNVSCLGVVVDDSRSRGAAAAPAIAEGCSMREILDELGLHHVKVLTSSSSSSSSSSGQKMHHLLCHFIATKNDVFTKTGSDCT
jgi:hypothetical protein